MLSKVAALIALAAGPALAEETGWRYETTALMWLPDTQIGIARHSGEGNAELDIGDAIKALDFVFRGSFEATRGRRSLIGNLVYSDLSVTGNTPLGTLFDTADVATQITAGLPPSTSGASNQCVDPTIAMRGRHVFDRKGFGTTCLDVGGLGAGSGQTYQAAVGVGYDMNEPLSLPDSGHDLDLERENIGNTLAFRQSEIRLGASYRC